MKHIQLTLSTVTIALTLALAAYAQKAAPAKSPACDAANGRTLFEKRCTGCHSLTENHEGPHLAGVYGRKAGSVPGFDYTPGLQNSGIIWTDTTLDRWLTDTDAMIPDNTMNFRIPNPQDRRDLIAYLRKQ
jgi:cytochrome c